MELCITSLPCIKFMEIEGCSFELYQAEEFIEIALSFLSVHTISAACICASNQNGSREQVFYRQVKPASNERNRCNLSIHVYYKAFSRW